MKVIKKIKLLTVLTILALSFTGCTPQTDISIDTEQRQEAVADIGSGQEQMTEETETDLDVFQETTEIEIAEIEEPNSQDTSDSEELAGTLEVHFIDVGQGDSIFLTQGEHHMLIDAGENDCGTKVQAYLQANNVSTLDYVVGTHPDSDHIGGMDVILYKFQCENVLMPDFSKDTKTYEDVITTASQKGYTITNPVAGENFYLGDAAVTVLAPAKGADYGDDANNYSIALKVTYKDTSFVFTGDCEEEAEEDIVAAGMDLQADVMKAGHHGSNTSNTIELLQAVAPKSVVISCGEDNEYGHPRAEVLNNLRAMGIQVYRTDEQGTIVAVSDGKDITWNTSPSDSWQAGEPKGSSGESTGNKGTQVQGSVANTQKQETVKEEQQVAEEPVFTQSQGTTYILNTNSKKIHYPSCSSVDRMSESNKRATSETMEQLISQGYEPCKKCNP